MWHALERGRGWPRFNTFKIYEKNSANRLATIPGTDVDGATMRKTRAGVAPRIDKMGDEAHMDVLSGEMPGCEIQRYVSIRVTILTPSLSSAAYFLFAF